MTRKTIVFYIRFFYISYIPTYTKTNMLILIQMQCDVVQTKIKSIALARNEKHNNNNPINVQNVVIHFGRNCFCVLDRFDFVSK